MKILNFKELLKIYKMELDDPIVSDEFEVVNILSTRAAIIDMINDLNDLEMDDFLKIDQKFINLLHAIYEYEENHDIKESVSDGNSKIYFNMQTRLFVA